MKYDEKYYVLDEKCVTASGFETKSNALLRFNTLSGDTDAIVSGVINIRDRVGEKDDL